MVHVRRLAVHAFFPSLVCILSSALAADLGGLTKEGKLAPEWVPSLGAKSIGSITTVCFPGGASDAQALPDSVLLQAEPRMHALVRRNNDLRGTDVNPLYAAVLLRTQPGSEGPTVPGMYLYWDNYDYLSIRGTGEGHVYCHAVVRGAVVREYSFWNVMRELPSGDWRKWRESWFRIQLVSRNAVFYMSSDGLNWHKLGEAGCRPGEPGKEPRMIILGRGWPGEGQTGRPEMCNDYYPDGNKQLSKTFFTRFSITDNVPIVGEIPAFDKKETWEKTLAALEADGIPRSWSFLGPISSKDIPIRKLLGPDLSDDWTTPQKDAGGNPLKSASWTVPGGEPHAGEAAQDAKEEEALDGYVDLAEHVGQAAQSLAWAKAEVNWPARGNALLWFGSSDIISLYVNNQLVHADADEWNDRRAFKDRFCVPVALNKGRNTLKVRCRQARGEWGFYLRLERNDPAYRARLLEKLLEAFPETAAAAPAPAENWRAAQARHEIVRCYQSLGDYRGALSACDKALAAFAHDDENRLQAFETKLHLLEFLRDADNLVKAGEEYLAAHSGTAGAASAMRAALRGDALAGRAEAAQNRAKRFCAGLADSAVIERTYRDLAVAFKEAGDNEHHLWTLDSLADQAGVEPLARAQAAIESAVSRWALERQRVALQPAQPLDPGKMSLACRSAAKALEILPGAKNPMAAALARDAEADLKAAKPEQAMAGYWGALLLALCASNHEAAPYLSFSKAFKIAVPQKDKDGKPLEDPNLFRKVLWKAVAAALGDPAWTGKWRFVGFTLEPTANLRTPLEPERDPGKSDYGQGRRWQELDLEPDPFPDVYRGNCDLGIDLKKWSGTAQVGYVARDFEVSAAAPGENTTTLRLGACGSWFAWVDGQPVGENTNVAGFRFEESRVQLNLYPGKHRLLLKLEAPPEGPFAFRARLSHEPELAAHLLVQALTVRQFPRTIADRRQDLQWLLGFMQAAGFLTKGSGNEVPYLLANIISQLYADTPAGRLEPLGWACERMRDAADSAQTVAAMQKLIALLETIPWYADRDRQVSDLYLRLALALVSEGRPAEADGVLRDFCAHYSHVRDFYFQALTLRGSLRRDFGQNLGALPFFECVMREYPFAWKTLKPAAWGLEWARTYRPERLIFDTSHEAQAVLDAIRRQLGAGGAEDIERAMRNIGELLASAPGSLSKVVDSPYYTRFVGMREYIRALLASLPEGARDVYRKAVAQPSSLRLKTATHLNDVAALEALANEYYYTPAADAARNRAGNLYLDRGQYAQAASMFQALLKQPAAAEKPRVAHLYAKLARALIADGQPAAAEAAIERLRAECAAASLVIGGETMTGMRLAEKLKIELAHSKTAGPAGTPALPEKAEPGGRVEAAKGDAARSAATHLSNLGRTGAFLGPAPVPGAVVWARPLIPQVAMMAARGPFELVARSHVPSFPVAAEDKVFITGLESARALDLVSGKVLWTRTWGSGGPLLKGSYNGYPLSCPTVRAGRLYMRALESGVSSIRCYAAENGRLRWSTSAAPELRKLTWIGDPAAAYNLVFAVYLEPGDLNTHGVAAMDEDSGRLRWKTNLVTGATGIKVADQYWMSTLHLGPPAVEGGELYVASGLASVASLNAFSGEVKWITTYPRLQFADPQHGFSSAGYDLRLTSCKTFARGPLSPMLAGDLVLVAPKDGCGLLAFERQGGAVRWQLELADCRYLAGIADGNALLCDDGVTAVNLANGRAVWEYRLQDDFLYGQPTLSGGLIYLPARKQLQRVDARTGRLVGASAWDPRLGPLANFAVVGGAGATPCLVGVGENVIGALGAPDAKPVALPLYEARDLEAAGKFEAAAAAYEKLLSSKDTGEVLHALTARIRLLEKLGKHEAALAALEQFERDAPEMLSSFNGLWQVRKDVLAQALRARLGQPAPPDNATPASAGELGALLTFSAFLPGENCALHDPSDKPRENCFVCTGGDILCMSLGTGPGMLWRNYAGPGVGRVLASSRLLAAVADSRITVFDRATGETLCELSVPAATTSARQLLETKRFEEVALGDNALVAATDAGLYAWELPRGKMIWWKQLFYTTRMVPGGLAVSGERVFTVQGAKDQKVNTAFLEAFDLKTGNEMQSLPLCPRCASMLAKFSPDAQLVLYRADRAVVCASTAQMKMLWKADLPKLDTRRDLFAFQDDYIRYHGVENGKWNLLWLNPADGKELRPRTQGFGIRMNGEYVVFSGDWNRTITRQRAQVDKVEKVWEISLPEPAFRDHYLLSAISGPERLHLLYVRCRNNQDQFLCRAFSWETGQLLNEQTLPGTPIRLEDNSFGVSFVQRGNTLVYTAREGVFIYSGVDQPPAKQVEQLRAELAKPELPAARRRSLHSAWVDLEPPELMAFLAPEDVQIDGDLSEWQSTEPIRLQGPLHYVPLAGHSSALGQNGAGGGWTGEEDLSARLYVGWNREGLALAVDVTDDVLCEPQPGMELTSGDCLRVVVDGRAEAGSALDRGESFVGTLAWVQGRSVLDRELSGTAEETGAEPQGRVLRAPNGKGYRYEMLVPWALIRKDPAQRPGQLREMRLGVAIYDDDGAGVKGALELGAGTTLSACVPQWLCRLTLLDVSQEKIERYRQVINLLPDCEEAGRFLDLILLSKRGDKAEQERAAELEGFISAHPGSRTALRALGQLRAKYKRLGGAEGQARLNEFLQRIKAPQHMQQAVSGAAFKFWVLPDPKSPPQMLMVQFVSGGDPSKWLRAYWGSVAATPCAAWGRDGSKELLRVGPLPKAGEWTELSLSPFDLGLEGAAVKEIAFTSFGGLAHFDRAAVVSGGKETVIIDDAWPEKTQFKGSPMKFVDQPHHDGTKSWTFDNADPGAVLRNGHIISGAPAPLVSFVEMLPPAAAEKPDPAAQQELFRKVSRLIPDTPEGFVFLQRVLDLYSGETKNQKCIDELLAFLKANPTSINGPAVMRALHYFYNGIGEKDPRTKCEAVLMEYKLPRDVKRAYFNEFAPVWSEWHVLGPFAAQGELRGMDVIFGPERGVDMNWKTVNASGAEVGWKKISNRLGADKKPNWDPVVDLCRHLIIPRSVLQKGPCVGFAYTKFNVPSKRRALFLFGAQDIVSMWLNGKRVVNELETQASKDKEAVEVQLRSGENELLIKVGVSRDQRLGFVFRLADTDGRPFPDVQNE